ncbi:MAG: hypothetical protein ABMB14_30660, partial [Myxococcota bacterium]
MSRSLTVRQARLVLPDRVVTGDIVVEDGVITEIAPRVDRAVGIELDGRDRVVLPGAIDLVAHLESVEDLSGISSTAAVGGYTSLCGVGPAETAAELKLELGRAVEASRVHCGLYIRATADNLDELRAADRARGIWVSGAILHDPHADALFAAADRVLVIDNVDPARLAARAHLYPDTVDPADHKRIQDVDSAVAATRHALDLAQKHGRPVILAHVSTAEEVELARGRPPCAFAAVQPTHLFLDDSAYAALGTRVVASPPVRGPRHREALWEGLTTGVLDGVCTGHWPVRPEWKDRPYPQTAVGMPTAQWTLPLLLDAALAGRCSLVDVVRWTAERPARALKLPRKGRLE